MDSSSIASISSMTSSLFSKFRASSLHTFLISNAFWCGLVIRFTIAWIVPRWMDATNVPYTDIDYHIFTDAADYVQQGDSPYDRQTYRYTPFLALFLRYCLPYYKITSRYFFCLADVFVGQLLPSPYYWTYNPLAINISTRGSAESLLILLPVLATLKLVQQAKRQLHQSTSSSSPFLRLCCFAGMLHGLSIHLKLYPIIYTLAMMVHLTRTTELTFQQQWLLRLFQPGPLLFALIALATFALLTLLTYLLYGHEALQHSLYYHLGRLDHRHNYSMWWYPIYTSSGAATGENDHNEVGFHLDTFTKLSMILPQLVLMITVSLGIPHLPTSLFLITYIFVTFNKVITAQYFTWYLVLLGYCEDFWVLTNQRVLQAVIRLIGTVVLWLLCAYGLEMQGWATHRFVWMASVAYFFANVNLIRTLCQSANRGTTGAAAAADDTDKLK